ncbi:hypothetical protein DRN67_03095 [Candidatus Micrarchaeota archaeon]|nr:MAG: hypothetical protein DRN67_03095 [Candidatus Micrarchaeota archaeon]
MKIWIAFIVLLLLSAFAVASVEEEHNAEESHEEEHHGVELDQGLMLIGLASLGSIILLALVYFGLSKR